MPPDLSSLKLCVSAGEALPTPLFNRWKEKTGLDIIDSIGSTEVVGMFISNRIGEIKPGSSGKPVPGTKVKIVDDQGKEVKRGESGTPLIKASSLLKCYWNLPDKTSKTFQNGWFNTGDTYLEIDCRKNR